MSDDMLRPIFGGNRRLAADAYSRMSPTAQALMDSALVAMNGTEDDARPEPTIGELRAVLAPQMDAPLHFDSIDGWNCSFCEAGWTWADPAIYPYSHGLACPVLDRDRLLGRSSARDAGSDPAEPHA